MTDQNLGSSNVDAPGSGDADVLRFDNIPKSNAAYETARWLAERGLPVFPCYEIQSGQCSCSKGTECQAPGKHPRTHNGVKDATTDPATITSWDARWPNANWAATGALVIDVDPRKNGFASLDAWGALASTWTVTTGGAGRHYFYVLPDGISNRNNWLPGVDVKAGGGYAIVAGSNHISGGRYSWEGGVPPSDPLPQAPQNLLDSIRSASTNGSTSGGTFDVAEVISGVSEGQRNDSLFRFACWARRTFRDDRQLADASVRQVNQRFQPPLSEAEVTTIVGSAFKQDHETVRAAAIEWAQTLNASDGWDEPIPLVTNEGLPTFPTDALPPVLKNMAEAVAEANQVPVDLAASMSLAALAASLVGRVETRVTDSWTETANVYVLGLIDSGNRKSSTQARLVAPLIGVQTALQEDARSRIAFAKARKKRLQDVAKAAATELRKNPTDPSLIVTAEQANLDAEGFFVEALPLLMVSDATPEAVGMRLAEQDERLSVFDAEGGGLITMMGARYSGKGTPSNLDMLLKAHDGGATTVTRAGRDEPMVLNSPQLTIGVLSQPETLREVMGVSGAFDRGLVARMMIVAPGDTLGSRKVRTTPVPEAVEMAYAAMLSGFVQALWPLVDVNQLTVQEAGVERLLRFSEAIEPRLARDGDLRPLGGFAGKIVGAAARYATLHHLGWYGPQGLALPVTDGSIHAGIRIAEYTIEHYRYVMAATGFVAEIAIADRIIRWLKRGQRSEFKRRDVQKELRIERVDELDGPLQLLEEHAYIRWIGVRRTAKAGRNPSDSFAVNPSIWRKDSA